MADQLDPKVDDRFDIGDTSIDPILDNIEDAPAPKPVPPKGPDGKFLPRKAVDAVGTESAPQHQHPKALVSRARDLGYTPTEIAARDTDSLLEEVHAEEARELRELRRQALTQKAQDTGPTPFEQLRADPIVEDGLEEIDEELRLTVDKKFIDLFAGFKKDIVALKEENKQLRDMEQARQNMSQAQIIDQTFDSLGLSNIIGKGSLQDLKKSGNDKAVNLRLKLVRLASMEDPKDSLSARIKRVATELYGGISADTTKDLDYEEDPMERSQRGPSRDEWDAAAVARPDNRSPHSGEGLPKGDRRALNNAAKKMGVPTHAADDDKSRFLGN